MMLLGDRSQVGRLDVRETLTSSTLKEYITLQAATLKRHKNKALAVKTWEFESLITHHPHPSTAPVDCLTVISPVSARGFRPAVMGPMGLSNSDFRSEAAGNLWANKRLSMR